MLGSNVPTIGGFSTAFSTGDKWGCECIQIYLTYSRKWKILPKLQNEIVIEFQNCWRNSLVKEVVGHIPFLVNLATPNDTLWNKSIERVITELLYAQQLGVKLLVLHLGSSTKSPVEKGIRKVITALDTIFQDAVDFDGYLLIETMAGQGNTLGSSFTQIANILSKVQRTDKMGVCLDTAHIFASGYDIRGYRGYEKVLSKFDRLIGTDRIKVIHLNDSKASLGSRLDRHAGIGKGTMGLQVFHAIMRDCRFSNTPKIIEVPERDIQSQECLDLLRELQQSSDYIIEKQNSLKQFTLEELVKNEKEGN